jgi:predicted N-acetyltransferase YhbS
MVLSLTQNEEANMSADIRTAKAQDSDTIFEILRAAFQLESRPNGIEPARRMSQNDFASFLLLEEYGQTVGVVHIGRHRLQIGRSAIIKGDVGHVAIRPHLQGRGYGTKLMQNTIRFMGENGFHVTRLGGLMKFYSRFGYEPFPRRHIKIPVAPMDSFIKGVKWSDIRSIPEELSSRVRRYHPARDYVFVHTLRQAYNEGRPGSFVPDKPGPAPSAGPDPNGLEFVYEENGALRGYLKGSMENVHAKDAELSYRLNDFAMDIDYPKACEALFKTFIWEAAKVAPTVIRAQLPYDERLFAAINEADIAFEVAEMHQAADGNMMRVLDLPELLEAITPELSARLVDTGVCIWQGCMNIVLPGQQAWLKVTDKTVRPVYHGPANAVVKTTHSTFLKWVFGISGFSEFSTSFSALMPTQRLLLSVLFPRLPCASGPWG